MFDLLDNGFFYQIFSYCGSVEVIFCTPSCTGGMQPLVHFCTQGRMPYVHFWTKGCLPWVQHGTSGQAALGTFLYPGLPAPCTFLY